jgi:hypothetical protein
MFDWIGITKNCMAHTTDAQSLGMAHTTKRLLTNYDTQKNNPRDLGVGCSLIKC